MTKNISRLLAVFLAVAMCICSTAPVYALEVNNLENADIDFAIEGAYYEGFFDVYISKC